MGGGVAYRAGNHWCSDKCVLVRGHISSLVAEGAAALCLLTNTPLNTSLTILTDSANVMYAMQHCSRRELWRDLSRHPEEQLISALAVNMAKRTGPTMWVKIKSHRSVHLNEEADR
jgi:hypothetical protein